MATAQRAHLIDQIDTIGREYAESPSPHAFQSAVELAVEFINWVVSTIRYNDAIGAGLSREDLEQTGALGYIAALKTYNPQAGAAFHTWATLKIRGAVMDAIRRGSPTSRTRNIQMLPLDDIHAATHDDFDFVDAGLSPNASYLVQDALHTMPPQQALALLLGLNGVPLLQIAGLLALSRRQVFQLRHNALVCLRDRLSTSLGEYL